MGQRSQIYIHFNVDGNEGLIARYFHWNYAERMVSRARSIIEKLKDDYLEHKYLFGAYSGIEKLSRYCDINFDMRDIVVSADILEECKNVYGNFKTENIFGEDNNDGQLLIDVTDKGIKYCFIEDYTEAKPMTAEEYMKWDTSDDKWHEPDRYTDKETIEYTERNIEYINSVAELMTADELNEFINRDYEEIINKGEK